MYPALSRSGRGVQCVSQLERRMQLCTQMFRTILNKPAANVSVERNIAANISCKHMTLYTVNIICSYVHIASYIATIVA